MRAMTTAATLAAAMLFAAPAWAGSDSETGPSMDEALAQADSADADAATAAQQQATGVQALQIDGDMPIDSGTAFNPAISIILDSLYSQNFSGEDADPPGFGNGHDHGHGHGDGHSHGIEDGFQIREVEAIFSGSVDPYFDLVTQFGITENDIEIEEAFFTTTNLPAGLQVKGGKFFSDIGYTNRKHTHDWDFTDQPLVIDELFGEEGLNELGAQVAWVAPTQSYTRLGFEVLEGDNEELSPIDGGHYDDGESVSLSDPSSPRLFTAFGKWGPDLGYDNALQLGLSAGYAPDWQRVDEHSSRFDVWEGDAWFIGADAVFKHDAGRSHGQGNWTLQAEYFLREIDYDFVATDGGGNNATTSDTDQQDGLYIQGLYGFAPRWNAGLRFDALGLTNDAFEPGRDDDGERIREAIDFGTTYRYSAQVSYLPTEFSRLRFQLSQTDFSDGSDYDDHGYDDAWRADLQFTFALGVHGAHDF